MTIEVIEEVAVERPQQMNNEGMDTLDPDQVVNEGKPAKQDCHQYHNMMRNQEDRHQYYRAAGTQKDHGRHHDTVEQDGNDYCQPTSSKVLVEDLVTDAMDDEHHWEFHVNEDTRDAHTVMREKHVMTGPGNNRLGI